MRSHFVRTGLCMIVVLVRGIGQFAAVSGVGINCGRVWGRLCTIIFPKTDVLCNTIHMHIVGHVPLPRSVPSLGSLKLLAFSTNGAVCFGKLVAYAVVFFGCGLPWLVVLPMMSALCLPQTPHTAHASRGDATHQPWLGSGLEKVRHGKQIVVPYT
jgi:hypothetical protein